MKYILFKHLHFAWPKLISLWDCKSSWEWTVRFSKECAFEWKNSDSFDLNKLCGVSFGWNHHKDSVRVTWVPDFANPGYIKLYGYTYDPVMKGHTSKYITTVKAGINFKVRVDHCGEYYAIAIGDKVISMDNNTPDKDWGFRLYPYFGGNNRCPQTMSIYLDKHE